MSVKVTKVRHLPFREICSKLELVGSGSKHYQHLVAELGRRSKLEFPKAVDREDWLAKHRSCTMSDGRRIAQQYRDIYESLKIARGGQRA